MRLVVIFTLRDMLFLLVLEDLFGCNILFIRPTRPPSSSTLLRTLWWAMRMILRSMQLFLDRFCVLSGELAESEFGSNEILVFEEAHEAEP